MVGVVGADIVARLKSSNWKDRLAAMEDLQQRVQDMKENLDASMLIQVQRHGSNFVPWLCFAGMMIDHMLL